MRGKTPRILFGAVLLLALASPSAASIEEMGMELSTPVRHQLRLLQDAWQGWIRAYYKNDPEAAASALDRLTAIAQHMGMSRLPDLSIAGAAFAVQAAQEGDFERARWVLQQSRQLDPERPETDFAAATVRRLDGNYLGAVTSYLGGYIRLSNLPLERKIWLQNAAVWLIYVLVLSGGLFVALQAATKGEKLYYDLVRVVSPPASRPVADVLVIAALIWPLLLPSGVLWLVLYWSILLWGYGSFSERSVMIALWIVVGATPLFLSYQQRTVQSTLVPPTRAIEQLQSGRLYGALFSDLGVLRTLLPDSSAVLELVADLHRRFEQWDHARSLYHTLINDLEQGPAEIAAPLNNLGIYHLRRKEYGTAVGYFERATEADPRSAEAHFNLSQAFSGMYEFDQSHDEMARARAIDAGAVEVWARADPLPEEAGIGIDGGLRRSPEIREQLRTAWGGAEPPSTLVDLWRQHFSLSILVATLVLAVTVQLARRQAGARSETLPERSLADDNRWLRALVPGLVSADHGRGVRGLLALLLPVALVMLPLVRGVGYRTPLGYDPGQWLSAALAGVGLALFFLVRLGWELNADG